MQTDLSDGLAALAKDGIVDPKRACIVGASCGGYAALAGVTLQHGLYRCAVAVAGQSEAMAKALKHADKPFEYVVMNGEDHWLSRENTRLTMLKSALAFVEKYDPPDAAPATPN
jgi:dipeptidyl aminopeptidase/acylaminoacyl peptidase